MLDQLLLNNAKSTLAVAVTSASQAAIQVKTGDGVRFPNPQPGDEFNVTLDDGTNVEILTCIAVSGDVLTCLRGVEGTGAQSSFAINVTRVELRMTADTLRNYSFRRQMDTKSVRPNNAGVAFEILGTVAPTVVNSQIASPLTNSSYREQSERQRLTHSNSASEGPSWRIAQRVVSGMRGYRFSFRFGLPLVPNSSHFFVGLLNSTTALAPVFPPSSITNGIAVGWDNAGSLQGTFLNVYAANSAGPASKLSLSSFFNVNTQAWYEVEFYQQPGNARIDYTVRRLDVGSIADVSSFFATGIPDNSLWLSPYVHGASMVTSAMAVEVGPIWWIG